MKIPLKLPDLEYELTLDGDDKLIWRVHSVRIREALNAPYRAVIDASIDLEIDSDALLGADASLRLFRDINDPQYVFGIVIQVDHLGFADHRLHLRLHIGSAFELLSQEFDSWIWQGATVLDILKKRLGAALGDYGRTLDVGEVSRGMVAREYCVQYRESVYGFACRLLEEEGISYAFVHDPKKGHEVLRLYDANSQYQPIVSMSESDDLPIIFNNADDASIESVQLVEWSRTLTSTAVVRRDFDWTSPEQPLTGKAEGSDVRGRVRRLYLHNGRRFAGDDLEQRAKDAQAAAALLGAVYNGRSNATVLRPGLEFKLSGHAHLDPECGFIVIGIRHSGQPDSGARYSNEFEFVPVEAEIRPAHITPKPQVRGLHTAIVTGDDEIHTDKHGRIQVQFSWEETPTYTAGSSCWIRCTQSWSGGGWGAQFIPRVGMQVAVEFVEGNPDRPLVTGCVYDGSREHPFAVPDSKTQSGWRTRSSPNSQGFNELRFEDAAGNEEIYIHAERNLRTVVKAAESRSVGASRSTTIGADDVLTVHQDMTTTVETGNRTTTVTAGSDTLTVNKDMATTVETGNRTTTVAAGSDTLTVKQDLKFTVENGMWSKSVPNGADEIEAKTVSVKGAESITLECGGSKIVMTPGDVSITSPLIKLN